MKNTATIAILLALVGLSAHRGRGAEIENRWVRIEADDTNGTCRFIDQGRDEVVLDDIAPRFDRFCSRHPAYAKRCSTGRVDNAFGPGTQLSLSFENAEGHVYTTVFALYEQHPFIDISWSVRNGGHAPTRVKHVDVLNHASAFGAQPEKPNLKSLDGNGGGSWTSVRNDANLKCHNNLLVTFGEENGMRRSLVIGGLTYHDYQKWASAFQEDGDIRVRLYAPDAIGKHVDPGQIYASKDRFYIDFATDNPFEALEAYGMALRKAQPVELNMYTFPSVCMWYLNFRNYGGGQTGTNDSPGAVQEMRNVVDSGFLNYSTVAVRLVPDNYGYNNQQGWWDAEHWARYGSAYHTPILGTHYKAPYETSAKWAGAIRELGGIPLTYFQSSWRSEDYAQEHPGHMLFNHSLAWRKPMAEYLKAFPREVMVLEKDRYPQAERDPAMIDEPWPMHEQGWDQCRDRNSALWSYDFTDPDFIAHMREVYRNLREAGVEGLMFDYPYSAWVLGGLEDETATQGEAYRNMFRLAYEGLGPKCWIHERNILKGSDMALGLVASQRTQGDNDKLNTGGVWMGALRWYKNRVVVNYDADSKRLGFGDRDKDRRVVTMSYVASGRLLLATSFGAMSRETIHDLSRTYPYHAQPKSARPVDAFVTGQPRVFDFAVNDDWHLVTLYNDSDTEARAFDVPLAGDMCFGALALDPAKAYYVYDFWNDTLVGRLKGTERLKQEVRPSEARMLAIHAVAEHPQFISTDRHIMQGYNDLKDVRWDAEEKTLSGTAAVVADDPYRVVVALNGRKPLSCGSSRGACTLDEVTGQPGLVKLRLEFGENAGIEWSLRCE